MSGQYKLPANLPDAMESVMDGRPARYRNALLSNAFWSGSGTASREEIEGAIREFETVRPEYLSGGQRRIDNIVKVLRGILARGAARSNPVKSSKGLIARAESWWGVSHNVPARGTAAHKRMVAKFRKTHPHARMNPMRKCAFCRKAPGTVTVTGNKSGSTTYFACAKCAKPLKKHKDLRVAKIRSNPITTREGRVLRPENCSKSVASHLLSERKAQGRKGKRKSVREGRCDYRAASYALRHGGEGSFMGIDGRLLGWWPSSK